MQLMGGPTKRRACAQWTRLPRLDPAGGLCDVPNSPVNMHQIASTVSHLTSVWPAGYCADSATAAALRGGDKALMSELFEARIGPLLPKEQR
jgi:hypothetical protein